MKIAIFPIFDPTWTHILVPTGYIRSYIITNYVTLGLTNLSKNLENNCFCYFWSKMAGKNLVLIFFKCDISCYFGIQFPLRYFYNHYLLLLNVFLLQNLKKAQMNFDPFWSIVQLSETGIINVDNTSFFVFSQHWTSNLAQLLPLRPHPLSFFCWLPMKYVRGFN